jgi:serine/threonine kinase 38
MFSGSTYGGGVTETTVPDGGNDTETATKLPPLGGDGEALSNSTKQKVAAAKQYIENHYKEQMKNLNERKERYKYFRYILDGFIYLVI